MSGEKLEALRSHAQVTSYERHHSKWNRMLARMAIGT
jgi:hypothetical protein